MPGSKTYTANKVNELYEIEVHDTLHAMEHKHGLVSNAFWEVLKISLSVLLTAIVSVSSTSGVDGTGIDMLIYYTISFIILYVVLTALFKLLRLLIEILFSARIFPSVKKEYYNLFHKRTLNYIYLGISFENKYSSYLEKCAKEDYVNNPCSDTDLIINYLSQSVYYFFLAQEEFDKVIPKRTQSERKEKLNKKFLEYIGFPYLTISLASAKNALERLVNHISCLTSVISKSAYPDDIKNSYTVSISKLGKKCNIDLIPAFSKHLFRINSLNN